MDIRADETRVNQRIRVPQIRVIDADGQQIGILPTRDALKMAEDRGYDLVEISPAARPPVCRIMDYRKYKYELSKKEKDARKKQHVIHVKEMRFTPKIEEHDYQFKISHVRHFLEQGNKVKIVVEFRGRQMVHKEFGLKVMERAEKDLEGLGVIEQRRKFEGRNLIMTILPKN